jgi:hypothetical protein
MTRRIVQWSSANWGLHMARNEVEAALAAAIDAESAVGIRWWPGSEMAPIAFRRWSSFSRRNGAKHPTLELQILDLGKGLQAQFEPEGLHTPMSEWLHLARILAAVFARPGM